jgi:hypothetical protein
MDCSFINKNLFAIIEDTLSPDVRSEIYLHIKSCKDCSLVISDFQETIGLINKDKSKKINPFMSTRILQRIESVRSRQADSKQKVMIRVLQPLILTFSLFLAVLIGFSLGKKGMSSLPEKKSADIELQSLRTELFISDITDEDKTLFMNP